MRSTAFWYKAVAWRRLLLLDVAVAVRTMLQRLVPDLSTRSTFTAGQVLSAVYPARHGIWFVQMVLTHAFNEVLSDIHHLSILHPVMSCKTSLPGELILARAPSPGWHMFQL